MSLKNIILFNFLVIISLLLIGCPAVIDPGKLESEVSSVLLNLSSDNTVHSFSVRGSENVQFVFEHHAGIENYDNENSGSTEPDGGRIHLLLPPGSLVDNIVPHVVLDKNSSYSPVGVLNLATVQNIMVTAKDNTVRYYEFTYEIEADTGNELTGFMLKKAANPGILFYDITADSIDSVPVTGTVTVTVPNSAVPPGVTVTDFVPSFEATGSSVSAPSPLQSGITSVTFNPTTVFTVNGTGSKSYNVTVNVLKNSAKDLLSFVFEDALNAGISGTYSGSISGNNININIPAGDITNLQPTVSTSAESTYSPAGPVNFTGSDVTPVVYTVTAEDGTTQNYNVSVNYGVLSSLKDINAFVFDNAVNTSLASSYNGTITGTDINIDIPSSEDITNLTPSLSISPGATVSPTGPVNFTGSDVTPVVYTVTAEDSSTQNYNVSVTVTGGSPAWIPLGGAGFSDSTAEYLVMDIMSDDRVVLGYQDSVTGTKTSALIQNVSVWNDLGTRGFSTPTITDLAIEIDDSDNVYTAYQGSTAGGVFVAKYDGISWAEIGAPVPAGSTPLTDLTTTSSGNVYIIYRDTTNANQVTVQEYNGSTWTALPTTGLSASNGGNGMFRIASIGDTVYAAYYDASNVFTIAEYSGSMWVNIGVSDFSGTDSNQMFDLIEANGLLYAVTVESSNLVVKKYESFTWSTMGTAVTDAYITTITDNYYRLAVNSGGDIYLFYRNTSQNPKLVKILSSGTNVIAEGLASDNLLNSDQAGYGNITVDSSGQVYASYKDITNANKITVMTYQ